MRILFWKRPKLPVAATPPSLDAQFPDVDPRVLDIVRRVQPYTMTSPNRLIALCDSIRYIVQQRIPGDIVECGVWRGGSMMAAALMLKQMGQTRRSLWLYDTYQGMSRPSAVDVDHQGRRARHLLDSQDRDNAESIWCVSSLDEVKSNLAKTAYPPENIHCIVGDVEQTIPATVPWQISLLRLDTDWYKSTRHELIHLFPRLSPGGVLLIDDYGHWAGCRKAVDEFLAECGMPLFLNRIDYTGRIGVKPIMPADQIAQKLAG